MTVALVTDPPQPGPAVELTGGVVRLTAPNPSIMTGPGTNTYLIGHRRVVVLDPGPSDAAHLDSIAEEAARRRGSIRAILVTHHHDDHAAGAAGLRERTGAPVLANSRMGVLLPDRLIAHGDVLDAGDLELRALHTPGHASDHLCFSRAGLLFSGDHVMGGSTVVIAPLDGDMTDYLASLEALTHLRPPFEAIVPGHGPVLGEPSRVLAQYLSHRLAREAAVVAALASHRLATVDDLVGEVYSDVPPQLHHVARYTLWAHLRKLRSEGRASATEPDDIEAPWEAVCEES